MHTHIRQTLPMPRAHGKVPGAACHAAPRGRHACCSRAKRGCGTPRVLRAVHDAARPADVPRVLCTVHLAREVCISLVFASVLLGLVRFGGARNPEKYDSQDLRCGVPVGPRGCCLILRVGARVVWYARTARARALAEGRFGAWQDHGIRAHSGFGHPGGPGECCK